jgi:hypothetical protein
MISIAKLVKMFELELAYLQALPEKPKPFGKKQPIKQKDEEMILKDEDIDYNKPYKKKEQARIKGTDEYEWYKYNGSKSITLLGARGEAGMMKNTLDKGAIFGIRPSSNPKIDKKRMVLKSALTRVFTVDDSFLKSIMSASKPVR